MNRAEQKEHFLKMAALVAKSGNALYKMLVEKESVETSFNQILNWETEGDEIQHELDTHFRTQRNIPYLALDRAKLLSRTDDILDDVALAARTYNAFHSSIPDDFPEQVEKFAEKVRTIAELYQNAVEMIYTDFKETLELCEEIEKMRDLSMNLSFELESAYFKKFGGDDWKNYTSIQQSLKKTMKYIASIKSASEILVLMAIKYD